MAGHALHVVIVLLVPVAIILAFLVYDRRTERRDAESAAARHDAKL